jgi:predicted DNA binding CopG/RHH family protein
MSTTIYYYCSGDEINSIGKTIEAENAKIDTSEDALLTQIIAEVKQERLVLENSIKYSKRGSINIRLKELDDIFDHDFACMKGFITANKNMDNEEIAASANEIWDLMGKYNHQLHKLSFEGQFTNANILFSKLEEPVMKAKLRKLVGVNDCFVKAKASLKDAELCYEELNAKESQIQDVIAPSSQKNILRNIINEKLLPHLNNWNMVQPDKYDVLLDAIKRRIEEVNAKARARKTRNANDGIEDETTED